MGGCVGADKKKPLEAKPQEDGANPDRVEPRT